MSDLLSCHIIERDNNDDILWTWTYPSVTEKQKALILRKCSFEVPNAFLFGNFFGKWFYISSIELNDEKNLPNVKQFAIVLWTKDLNTEKYEKLCRIMNKTYLESGNPTSVLQLYLNVVTKGACTAKENGTFLVREFGVSALPQKTMVKDLIKLFGLEIIVVYTVLLLKKRLVVYHHSLQVLLQWIQSFPSLMIHRQLSPYFFPWLDLNSEDLEQLKASTYYIAGFYDNSVLSRPDLYDVLVNLPAREISVSPNAKDSLTMTKLHKDIALYLVQLSEGDLGEGQVIKALAEKTQELINQLRALGKVTEDGKWVVSIETIKQKNISQAMESFLCQLAFAENMLQL